MIKRFVVITGTSGAGKTLALHSLEDAGFYAVDNLPPRMLRELATFCDDEMRSQAAVVIDTRSGNAFTELGSVLDEMEQAGIKIETLFLDANDEVLVQRYKETRRPHALFSEQPESLAESTIMEMIQTERSLLRAARALADKLLDTTNLTVAQLRDAVLSAFAKETRPTIRITITSFGFKYGIPIDADLVFDVRFLANPHYVATLKSLDGRDPRVAAFIHEDPLTEGFQTRMNDLIDFALPQYKREGKAYLNIAIGCTGGKHRSVLLGEELALHLREGEYHVIVRHRDIVRDRRNDAPPTPRLHIEVADSAVDEPRPSDPGESIRYE